MGILIDRYKNRKIETFLDYKQFTRKEARTIVHKSEEVTTISVDGKYKISLIHDVSGDLKSDAIDFTLLFTHEDEEGNTLLYSYKIEHTSIVVARELARRCKEILLRPGVKTRLWARALGDVLGFDADLSLSEGVECFFEEMAKHTDTELLELYLQESTYEPHKIAVENELKKRGEI